MAFDLTTSKPVSGGFDLGTAQPMQQQIQPPQPVQATPAPMPMQQRTPMQAVQGAADYVTEQLPTRSPTEKGYWTENVPQSVARLPMAVAAGMGGMAYDTAKEFTDPVYNALSGGESWERAMVDLFNAPKEAGQNLLHGLSEFVGAPIGLGQETSLKEAWSDPAAAVLGLAPTAKLAGKGMRALKPKGVAVNLAKKSLKFAPGVEPELQTRVANTMLREKTIPTADSYGKFKTTLAGLNKKVKALINPVSDTAIKIDIGNWAKKVLKKAETSGERSKDLKAIKKYVAEFTADHPNLTVAEAQKVKISINKKLTAYYKRKAAGSTAGSDARSDAMKAVSEGLRGEIEKFAPGTKGINSRIHDIIVARPFIKTATNKAANQPILSTRDFVAGFIGHQVAGPGGYTAALVGSRLIRDPRVHGVLGKAVNSVGELKKRIKGKFSEKGLADATGKIEPIITEIEQKLMLEGGRNQLALPAPRSSIQLGATQSPTINLGGPAKTFAKTNSFQRMFEIAQSAEGKKLLVERLGREQKYAALLDELLKIPDQPALPAGQGFKLISPGEAGVGNTMNSLGQKGMASPDLGRGGVGRSEVLRQNALARGLNEKAVLPKQQGIKAYHGTDAKFDKFSMDHAGSATGVGDFGEGLYFSNSRRVAKKFAEDVGGKRVIEARLNLKNPAKNKDLNSSDIQLAMEEAGGMGFGSSVGELLAKKGFDGIAYMHLDGSIEYVVFKESNVKIIDN